MKPRFFRFIWRINAILICLASVLVMFVCAVASYFIFKEIVGHASFGCSSPTAQETPQAIEKKLEISDARTIEGTTVVRCSLNSVSSYRDGGSFSSRKSDTTTMRNFLYCDLVSEETHWLLPNNIAVILSHDDFWFPQEKGSIRWTSFKVVDKDTNHDGILSSSDFQSFAVSQPNGTRYTVLITDIEDVMESKLLEENKMIVFYRKNTGVFFSMIDLAEMKVTSTRNIFEKK